MNIIEFPYVERAKAMQPLLQRNEIPEELTWNLADIYASEDAWERDFALLATRIPELERLHVTLITSATSLINGLQLRDEASQLTQRLAAYAHLRFGEDMTQSRYQTLVARITAISTQVTAAYSFFASAILSIPQATLIAW